MSNRIIQFIDGPSLSADEISRLERLKHTWYFASPGRLYDLCVEAVVRNPGLLLSRYESTSHRFTLAEHTGPLPANICKSLIQQQAKIYQQQLGQLERRDYFQIVNLKMTPPEQLVSVYEFLMALASRPDKANLSYVDYRQCVNARSTLDQRLRQREGGETSSIRARQPPHLRDRDLRLVLKHKCEYLEICPCELTNKSIYLINKHLNKHLKYLRLQNCCNWIGNREEDGEAADNENDEDNDDFYLYNLQEYLEQRRQETVHDEEDEEEEEEDEDSGDFDAYLQEYVSRYEEQRDEMSIEQMMDDEADECGGGGGSVDGAQDQEEEKRCRRHKRKHRRQPCSGERRDTEAFKFFIEGRRRRHRNKRSNSNQCRLFSKEEGERKTGSILKWIVKCTTQKPAQKRNESTSSFIDQIRQRAALLAETKMLDKVTHSK